MSVQLINNFITTILTSKNNCLSFSDTKKPVARQSKLIAVSMPSVTVWFDLL